MQNSDVQRMDAQRFAFLKFLYDDQSKLQPGALQKTPSEVIQNAR